MSETDVSLAGVVPAAGASRRLGRAKQLVEIGGVPLIVAAVRQIAPHCDAGVVVVSGAEHDGIVELLRDEPARVAYNPAWREGLGASIRQGVNVTAAGYTGLLLMLADQPRIAVDDIRRLVTAWRARPDCIAAACYDETLGVPVIFPGRYRDELVRLQGDSGARKILRDARSVNSVPMPNAAFDVDTPADLSKLLNKNESDSN